MRSQTKRTWSGVLAAGLAVSLLFPAGVTQAKESDAENGNRMPVLSTVPAVNAQSVRPDTPVEVQLDKADKFFKQWDRKFQDGVTLTLLNDGGQAVYTTSDQELRYDAVTGKLTFTPSAPLNRYTTYGVVIAAEKLPESLRTDASRKQLPQQPERKVEPIDPASLQTSTPNLPSVVEQKPTTTNLPSQALNSPQLQELVAKIDENRLNLWQQAQSTAAAQFVGPKPVRAIDGALKPIDVREGGNQKGVIERIEGSTVTLFGGRQFVVTADTHIHVPELPGRNQLADLKPGDFVTVTLNAHSDVQNINVTNKKDVLSFVFRTGSALHEPTHVQVVQKDARPRVTEDGHFTLVSTDDYGLPAWGSETRIELATADGSALDASAKVLPGNAFTTSNPSGREEITVIDHKAQPVVAKVSMDGPYFDGADAHGFVVTFDFRPGLPAIATINAPQTMEVGTTAAIDGTVTDLYGNLVEDGTALNLSATAGEISTPMFTAGGNYRTVFTAPTQAGDVTVNLKSQEGTAAASATIRLLPGAPHSMTLEAPQTLPAGESTTLKGAVQDRYGNAVADGTQLIFSATDGTIPSTGSTQGGAFAVDYTAPTVVKKVNVAAASEQGTAAADRLIQIVPGPVAHLTLQAKQTDLHTGDTTDLSGQAADRYGNLIDKQQVDLSAEHGTVTPSNTATNDAGLYASQYTAPFYNGADTVTAQAGTERASVTLNISSEGTGYNPETGQVEPVAKIAFEQAAYQAMPTEVISMKGHAYNANNQPLQDVVLTASATAGTVEGVSYKTDAQGAFEVTYRAQAAQGSATVTVQSGELSGQAQVNTLPVGYGYDPQTGQWVPVGSIEIGEPRYRLNKEYNMTLVPNATVELPGHVYSLEGHPLSGVVFDKLTATGGSVEVTSTDAAGAFTLTYRTPSTEGNQIVQLGSGNALTTLNISTSTLGYGINPVTRLPEPIAQIVWNPVEYTTTAGGSVTMTGRALNASGQALILAKFQLSSDGGYVTNQVVSSPTGTFTVTYLAPMTAGTYTVTGTATNSLGTITGSALVHVLNPQPPHFENPYITLTGGAMGRYWVGNVTWGATVKEADGSPSVDKLFTLDQGAYNFIDLAFTDQNGMIAGGPVGVNTGAMWQTYSPTTGYTYYAVLTFQMSAFDLDIMDYAQPSFTQSFQVSWSAR